MNVDAALAAWHEVDGDRAVDLFAGPGGWDLAALALKLEVLGVEWDDAACATRAAAGLRTLQADVSALDPADFGPVGGLIGSPPCPTFSRAGRGAGRHLTETIVACLRALADGRDTRAETRAEAYRTLLPVAQAAERQRADARQLDYRPDVAEDSAQRDAGMSVLVVEPLRWALELRPAWITLEQVPDVLPLWKVVGEVLEGVGYSTWCGVLEAERYGVPQTRERAVLIARRDGTPAHPPIATHQRYDPRVPRLDGPELTLEGEVLPWVSMADALSWGMTARPYPIIAGGTGGGPDLEKVGGSAARAVIYEEQAAGRWAGVWESFGHMTTSGGAEDGRWLPADDVRQPNSTKGGTRPGLTRSAGDPARTIDSRADQLERVRYDSRGQRDGRTGRLNRQRRGDEPAPTIAEESRNDSIVRPADGACGDPLGLKGEDWPDRRPATTIAGDPRVFQPGGHHGEGEQSKFAVRVTEREAGILQTFPPDYPWQGTGTARFVQIGNAVPPLLALRVLEAVTR